MIHTHKKGFTLVELLIVIAILAVLAVSLALVINPGELLAQARDGQRMNDLTTVRDAVNLFWIQQASPAFAACGATNARHTLGATAPGSNPFTLTWATTQPTAPRAIDGTGWVALNLGAMTGGSPVSVLPLDPTNTANFFYAFACSAVGTNAFELNARLESARYRTIMANDGGNQNTCSTFLEGTCFYEIGSALSL